MYCYLITVTVQLRTALDVGFASIAKSDRGGMNGYELQARTSLGQRVEVYRLCLNS
jgi:hypothetical protein